MILSTIRMAIPAEKHNDALKILRTIAAQSRDDPGCFSCHIYREIEDSNILMLQGSWETEENLKFHVRSSEYRNLLLVMEMSIERPEISFNTILDSTGIEKIEKIRSSVSRG